MVEGEFYTWLCKAISRSLKYFLFGTLMKSEVSFSGFWFTVGGHEPINWQNLLATRRNRSLSELSFWIMIRRQIAGLRKISGLSLRRYYTIMPEEETVTKNESEWRAILTPAQFAVLREKATERPNTGVYNHFDKSGTYACVGCGQPLYKSVTKFNSGCGWPAFYEGIPGAIKTETDTSYGTVRTEIMCSKCGGHLGHVFKGEGFKTPTDERHCVNSISLKFQEE